MRLFVGRITLSIFFEIRFWVRLYSTLREGGDSKVKTKMVHLYHCSKRVLWVYIASPSLEAPPLSPSEKRHFTPRTDR